MIQPWKLSQQRGYNPRGFDDETFVLNPHNPH